MFNQNLNVTELRTAYFKLAMIHHPDRGGDLETMKKVNNAYEFALKNCHNKEQPIVGDKDKRTYNYQYKQPEESALMEAISKILTAKLPGVTISLMGNWLWLTGDTKPSKDAIKALGYRYSSTKESWYFHSGKFRSSGRGKASLSEIASKYGRYDYDANQRSVN